MMLKVLKGLLKIAGVVADYLGRKQLLDAGQARAQKRALKEANHAVSDAIAARRLARRRLDKRGGVPDDYKYYRD